MINLKEVRASTLWAIVVAFCFVVAAISTVVALGRDPGGLIAFLGPVMLNALSLIRLDSTAKEVRQVAERVNGPLDATHEAVQHLVTVVDESVANEQLSAPTVETPPDPGTPPG